MRTQQPTAREQVLVVTRRLHDWRRVVELIGSLFSPPSTPMRHVQRNRQTLQADHGAVRGRNYNLTRLQFVRHHRRAEFDKMLSDYICYDTSRSVNKVTQDTGCKLPFENRKRNPSPSVA